MKVCLVTFDFPPFVIGGIGTLTYDLVYYLSKEGVDVHVLTAGNKDEQDNVNDLFKITRLKVPLQSKLRKIPTFQFRAWKWLKARNEAFDVIHFQEASGFLYFIFGLFGKQNKNTIEQFHHSHVEELIFHLKFLFKAPKESLPYLFIPLKILQEYISLIMARQVITVSNHSCSVLVSWGINSNKIAVIPNALSESYFKNSGLKANNANPMKFLYVGRLVPRKGVDILIEAIKILKGEGIRNIYVDIVGEGPLFTYCQNMIRRNDLNNCRMWGLVPQQELDRLYLEADCFICPSRLEGFGIVLLEAGANKLAIIANDIPVFREIYSDDEALYFKKNNPHALAEKMSELSNRPDLISMLREKARHRVQAFKWQNVVKDYMSIYLTIAAKDVSKAEKL